MAFASADTGSRGKPLVLFAGSTEPRRLDKGVELMQERKRTHRGAYTGTGRVVGRFPWIVAGVLLTGGWAGLGCGGDESSGGSDGGGDAPLGDPLGSTCEGGASCASGFCADGVCCDSACDGVCQECDSAGACVSVLQGEDPADECGICQACNGQGSCVNLDAAQTPVGDCDAGANDDCDGKCNGAGACEFPVDGTSCGACSVCDGAGACGPAAEGTDPNADCAEFCQDCDGEGACGIAVGRNPHGDCGTDADCAGTCDDAGECVYPLETPCGTPACVNNAIVIDECDGAGACVPDPDPRSCSPYQCIEAEPDPICTSSCVSNADCAPSGAVCDLRDLCLGYETGSCAATAAPLPVDCGAPGGNELQNAIDGLCGIICHLIIDGTCDPIVLNNKTLYVDGRGTATIEGGVGVPAISVLENGGQAQVALTGVGVSGVPGGAAGIEADSRDSDPVDVWLLAGAAVKGHDGDGVVLDNGFLCAEGAFVDGNGGDGIDANASTVVVKRSTILNNDGAGLNLLTTGFRVENTFIVGNATLGVDVFSDPPLTVKTFRHNTVADNTLGGMDCAGFNGGTLIQRSLFFNGATGSELVSGCTKQESDIPDADAGDADDACGDGGQRPLFEADYHLQAGSTCIDTVSCLSSVPEDFDGDPRPTGTMCDPGADER